VATPVYRSSIDPSFLTNLQSADFGDFVTPDGRSHPITGLTALDTFSNNTDVGVGIDPSTTPLLTGPTYTPPDTPTQGQGAAPGSAPTWGDFVNAIVSGGQGAGSAPSQPGTHFGIPHLGVRLAVATLGVGILLIVAARLVFTD